MAKWLEKATSALTRESAVPPPPFVVTCECGQQHEGLRKSRSQRIICQTCGAALFVLSRDAYPPPVPRNKKRRRSSGPPEGPSLPPVGEVASYVLQQSTANVTQLGRTVRAKGIALQKSTAQSVWGALRWMRAQLTPFRIVLAAITAILVGTLYASWQARLLEHASQTYELSFENGQAALERGDLAIAREQLLMAAHAADRLQLSDAQSTLVRQLARETTALTHLAPKSLYDMILEAEETTNRQSPQAWEQAFRVHFLDTWMILDAAVAFDHGQTRIVFPVTVGGNERSIEIHADLIAFEQLGTLHETRRLIFAAQVADCRLSNDQSSWQVVLNPDSGFLWCTAENLAVAGLFEADDEFASGVQVQLEAQSRQAGLP